MRIVAGKHRGRTLAAPPGNAVRPTSSRAREALFDILAHGRFAEQDCCRDAIVLDVFAGTGAFGLEALSRGARYVTFMEKDRAARAVLEQNVALLGEIRQCAIMAADATRPPRAASPANLAFLDPPYREDLAAPTLAALAKTGWFAPDALVVAELAARDELDLPDGFTFLEDRRYGAARFVFLRYGATKS
jgi:16S rRNA (guanine966-N2)-methyltransferase